MEQKFFYPKHTYEDLKEKFENYIHNPEEYQQRFLFHPAANSSLITELLCHRHFCFSMVWYIRKGG